MIKVSVLVAVYNTAEFLPRCLDSLLSQTLTDIEVICVDDASTDNSLSILQNYAKSDDRIRVIHIAENSGQAHARNIGLATAKGTYVCFLDSDDWYDNDSLEKCSKVLDENPDTDAVLFNLMMYYGEDNCKPYPMKYFSKINGHDAFIRSINWDIHGVYMLRTELHKKYPYDESLKAYSDDNTSRIHYIVSRNVCCSDARYYYRQHAKSVTHAVSARRFDYMKANESMKRQLLELGEGKNIIDMYENIRWMVLIDTYMFYYINRQRLSKEDAHYGLNEIHRIWKSINYDVLDSNSSKFGYRPYAGHWRLFRMQEEFYFFLRKLLHRNEDR